MNRLTLGLMIIVGTGWPCPLLAIGAEPRPPSAKERLNQVLNPEGGIHVYKDPQGNVTSTAVLPNGEHIIVIQPPQNPGLNLGPPLQLHNPTVQFPPSSPPPAQPPAPDFPQKAR